jgi:hypothetical protein
MARETKRQRVGRPANTEIVLTDGERLLLWRRRMDWNQTQAAQHYGTSNFFYCLAENDRPKNGFEYRPVNITLRPHEKCLIYRKRAKKLQSEIAAELGLCRTWLQWMEMGKVPCTKLLEWWEK